MTEEEKTLTQIKFVIDMYSAGADTADNAMEKIFDLVDSYKKGVAE